MFPIMCKCMFPVPDGINCILPPTTLVFPAVNVIVPLLYGVIEFTATLLLIFTGLYISNGAATFT